ncbi:MAG: response regulator [Acetobacteraceae bacterium]
MSLATKEDSMGIGGGQARGETQRRKILLVEDDLHVAETLAELLELEGFNVAVVHDAASGLRQAGEVPPDLVLCDLSLPGALDGHGFARACRADPALSGLRLFAVSGYCGAGDRRAAIASGFDELIAKPVDLARIHAAFEPA